MNCPACARTLSPVSVAELRVDACAGGCGGLWFDQFELKKVDEPMESVGESLLDIPVDPLVAVDLDVPRICPKCDDGVVMMRHFTSVKRRVTVDECPQCAGVWLDVGELRMIRSEFRSDEAREAAADAYFAELFDGPLAAARARSDAELAGARKFARALRFVCPSYYLDGRQDWGAF